MCWKSEISLISIICIIRAPFAANLLRVPSCAEWFKKRSDVTCPTIRRENVSGVVFVVFVVVLFGFRAPLFVLDHPSREFLFHAGSPQWDLNPR